MVLTDTAIRNAKPNAAIINQAKSPFVRCYNVASIDSMALGFLAIFPLAMLFHRHPDQPTSSLFSP